MGDNAPSRVAYLSQEYLPHGDLYCFLQYYRGPNHGGLQWVRMGENLCRSLLLSMVDGLQSVHKLGFAHADIKPDNICFDADY